AALQHVAHGRRVESGRFQFREDQLFVFRELLFLLADALDPLDEIEQLPSRHGISTDRLCFLVRHQMSVPPLKFSSSTRQASGPFLSGRTRFTSPISTSAVRYWPASDVLTWKWSAIWKSVRLNLPSGSASARRYA